MHYPPSIVPTKALRALAFALFATLLSALPLAAQVAADVVVPITVTTTASPVSITLSWTNPTGLTNIQVARKTINQTAWALLGQPAISATTFTDNTAQKGVPYEYLVLQQATGATPSQRIGLIYAGVEVVPVTGARGKVVLVVDSTLSVPLAAELSRLENDLRGDGWQPVRSTIVPAESTVSSVKALLKTRYNADPNNTVAAFLIGNIPVPYSGNINPDGHVEHQGAWPTDYYYGDMDEDEWTDASVNNSVAARQANKNIPGDGKFDQSFTPTLPEIVVSRVDFSNLSGWSVSQTELYRRYLNKDHNFRVGIIKPENATLVDDNFGYFNGEAFAQNGWRNGYAISGPANTAAGDFFNDTDNNSYLVGYGTGAGGYSSADGVGTSDNFKTDSVNIVFSMLFGSYFGDWDYETNPLMPSALASKGSILTCSWAGRPNWFLHHMALGEPILTSNYWVWLNSFLTSPVYPPNYGADQIHVGMLGDPTLRAHSVVPPVDLTAKVSCTGAGVQLSWTASAGANAGYLVYRSGTLNGVYSLLTANAVTGTAYTDPTAVIGQNFYQVKALRLETVPTGSYFNQSLAATTTINYAGSTSPVSFTSTLNNPTCNGQATGSIVVMANGGAGNFSYIWNTNATTATLSGIGSGTYSVTVTDGVGCTATSTATLTQPTAMQVTVTGSAIACFGNTTGTASASTLGGTAPYTYVWNTSATTPAIGNLAAGTYIPTITDANGCTQTATAIVTQPAAALTAQPFSTNINCNGAATGSIQLASTGGTAPYTTDWADLTGPNNPGSRTNLTAGNYSATVTDANGCTTVVATTITEPSAILVSSSTTNAACAGAEDGSITLTVNGGTGNYTYLWNNSSTTQNLTNIAAGNYTVIVTDAAGCSRTASETVNQNTTLTAQISTVNVKCFGGNDGAAFVNFSGGIPGYAITWSNMAATPQVTNLSAGTYAVTVTDGAGCGAFASVEITQPTVITGNATFNLTAPCAAQPLGNVALTVSGGTAPYTYLWNNNSTTAALTGVAVGIYTVTVSDANGCTRVLTNTAPQAPVPLAVTSVITNATCFGTNNGAINVSISGGTAPFNTNWTHLPGPTDPEDLTGIQAGTFTLIITDAVGCTNSSTYNVTQPNPVFVVTNSTASGCGTPTGTLTANANGGTAPFAFVWSNNTTGSPITNVPAGTYTVTATDANGCSATATRTVAQTGGPSVTVAGTNAGCTGSATGTLSATVSNGVEPYQYQWSNQETTEQISDLATGTYTVTITDANGCTSVSSGIVIPSAGIALSGSIQNVSCAGGANGSIVLSVNGGTPPLAVNWSNNGVGSVQNGLQAGAYSATVTDGAGCSAIENFNLTEPAPITATATITNITCNGLQNGTIVFNVTGGTQPFVYDWDDLQLLVEPKNRSNLAAGTYSLKITDANGCTAASIAFINEPAIPQFELTGMDSACVEEVINYNLIGFQNYLWVASNNAIIQQGQGTSSVLVEWTTLGQNELVVTFTDQNNCPYSDILPVFIDGCVDTDQPTQLAGVKIYPNPATDRVYIGFEQVPAAGTQLRLLDIQGRLLQVKYDLNMQSNLDVSMLPAGTYLVQIIENERIGIWKITIE